MILILNTKMGCGFLNSAHRSINIGFIFATSEHYTFNTFITFTAINATNAIFTVETMMAE